ncbi:MAG TPA: hypothetical protein DCO83_05325 [Mucilaginibacter sp.]|jgi:hypothetical protein|nr:hypothetical protein [Mucilaginibacter sp.]
MGKTIRKDIRVGTLEKRLGVAPGTITNPDGSDARSDKKLETLQKEYANAKTKRKTVKSTTSKPISAEKRPKVNFDLLVTQDQKSAARRTVKSNPKISSSLLKKVNAAIKKSSQK